MTLNQLRRIRWAVRSTLILGVAASVAANILHAEPNPIAQAISAWPPLALLLAVELISRVPVHRRSLAAVRLVATAAIAGIAAWVSYWHMAGVAANYGETGASPYLLPLSVDGLVVVASVSLVELAGRIRGFEHPHDATSASASLATGGGLQPSDTMTTAPAGIPTSPPPLPDRALTPDPDSASSAPASAPLATPDTPTRSTTAAPVTSPAVTVGSHSNEQPARHPESGRPTAPSPPAARMASRQAPASVTQAAQQLDTAQEAWRGPTAFLALLDSELAIDDPRPPGQIAKQYATMFGQQPETIARYLRQWRRQVDAGERVPGRRLHVVPGRK